MPASRKTILFEDNATNTVDCCTNRRNSAFVDIRNLYAGLTAVLGDALTGAIELEGEGKGFVSTPGSLVDLHFHAESGNGDHLL